MRSGSAIGNRFMFTGREYDEDFNLYEWSELGSRDIDGCAGMGNLRKERERVSQYRARAYSPYSGRFMTEDPKGFDAGDYNLFRYCKNDPLDLTDPMGLAGNGPFAVEVDKGPWGMMTGSQIPQDTSEQFPGALPYVHANITLAYMGGGRIDRNAPTIDQRKISTGLEAVNKAEQDHSSDGNYYGYNAYDVAGNVKYVKSYPGKPVQNLLNKGNQYEEDYPRGPAGGILLSNGHLHSLGSSSFSPWDRSLSLNRDVPVFKNSERGPAYRDAYYSHYRYLFKNGMEIAAWPYY